MFSLILFNNNKFFQIKIRDVNDKHGCSWWKFEQFFIFLKFENNNNNNNNDINNNDDNGNDNDVDDDNNNDDEDDNNNNNNDNDNNNMNWNMKLQRVYMTRSMDKDFSLFPKLQELVIG